MATILLAVDRDPLRSLFASVLSAAGHDVIEASGAAHALSLSGNRSDGIDLLCAHVDMDHMGGEALARELLVQYPRMKILLLLMENPRFVSDHEPAFPVLRKPFSIDQLLQTVEQTLEPKPFSAQHTGG